MRLESANPTSIGSRSTARLTWAIALPCSIPRPPSPTATLNHIKNGTSTPLRRVARPSRLVKSQIDRGAGRRLRRLGRHSGLQKAPASRPVCHGSQTLRCTTKRRRGPTRRDC